MQVAQHAKFRWTENLTSRFIQLRKENGKLFTGRKYSAQAGWECILQQMREEFPTIMANVHYRVLKKKWSNLLQQYKELKNPVHGDRNKADDISWPFYSTIEEVLEHETRTTTPIDDEYIDPHEFLCVSVTPEEETPTVATFPVSRNQEADARINHSEESLQNHDADSKIKIERRLNSNVTRSEFRKNCRKRKLEIPRLPRATDVTIEKISSQDLRKLRENDIESRRDEEKLTANESKEDVKGPRKMRRTRVTLYRENHESWNDRRIEQIFEYIKRRDEENRSIMMRLIHAVESIANKM